MDELETQLESLKRILVPSDQMVDAASILWMKDRDAVVKGATSTDGFVNLEAAIEILHEYSGLERLRYEAEALLEHYNTSTKKQIIFAIDPHVLRAYSEFTAPSAFSGFEFIKNEWETSESLDDRTLFLIYLCLAIAKSGPLCILEPGRKQIMGYYTHFQRQMADAEQKETDYFEKRLSRFETLTEKFENALSEEEIREDILNTKFKKLIGASSAGGIYADLSLTRMNDILRSGQFENVHSIIQRLDIPKKQKRQIFQLKAALDEEGNSLVLAKVQLDRAYSLFRQHAEIDLSHELQEGEPRPEDEISNRNKEYLNRSAALEIHTYNCIFDVLGINLELKYVSNSIFLYNFLKHVRNSLYCPLVHSRTYFAYANPGFYQSIREANTKALAHSSAAASVVKRDGEITKQELSTFQSFATTLHAHRNANAFGGVDVASVQQFLEAVSKSVALLKNNPKAVESPPLQARIQEIDRRLESVRGYLKEEVFSDREDVPSLLSSAIMESDESEPLYSIFANLAAQGKKSRHPLISIRMVLDKDGMNVKRLICLPIRGSYRYTFSITNSEMMDRKLLEDAGLSTIFKVFDINDLVTIVDKAILTPKRSQNKAKALRDFVRAVHAASYGDWSFALYLSESAHRFLTKVKGPNRTHRYYFSLAEVQYLMHLSKRGLAEQRYRGRRHVKELLESKKLLVDCANSLATAYNARNSEKTSPGASNEYAGALTFRIPLAFVGLSQELLVAQRFFSEEFDANTLKLDDLGPFEDVKSSSELRFYWNATGVEKLSLKLLWENPLSYTKLLQEALLELLRVIETREVKLPSKAEVSIDDYDHDLWNYRKLRCYLMLFNQVEIALSEMAFGLKALPNELSLMHDYAESLDRYDNFLAMLGENSDLSTDLSLAEWSSSHASPYAAILYISSSLRNEAEGNSIYEVIAGYKDIQSLEARLDPLGFPRSVSRNIRKSILMREYGAGNLAETLISEASKLTSEFL